MLQHQPAQGRAVALVIIFLQRPRGDAVEAEQMAEKKRDPRVDFRPEIAVGRIERIVEIEDPSINMPEGVGAQQRNDSRALSRCESGSASGAGLACGKSDLSSK